jgi:hypothetical protein
MWLFANKLENSPRVAVEIDGKNYISTIFSKHESSEKIHDCLI